MRISVLTAIFLTASILNAQTVINAITDAASYSPRVSPGDLATIFGEHLANNTAQASSFPLPPTLGGASVYAVQSSQSPIQAPLVYASATQINFQVPSGLSPGTANFYVTLGGGNSLSFTVNVVSAGPSIFQDTSNHAIAQDAGAGYATNSTAHPAASGSVVVVYLTGLGPVDHSVADGAASPDSPLSNATGTPSATIGGVNAPVQFLGLTPGYAGLAQANIQVPSLATRELPARDHGRRICQFFGGSLGVWFGNRAAELFKPTRTGELCQQQREQRRHQRQHNLRLRREPDLHHQYQQCQCAWIVG